MLDNFDMSCPCVRDMPGYVMNALVELPRMMDEG